jgi:hypothetical protein
MATSGSRPPAGQAARSWRRGGDGPGDRPHQGRLSCSANLLLTPAKTSRRRRAATFEETRRPRSRRTFDDALRLDAERACELLRRPRKRIEGEALSRALAPPPSRSRGAHRHARARGRLPPKRPRHWRRRVVVSCVNPAAGLARIPFVIPTGVRSRNTNNSRNPLILGPSETMRSNSVSNGEPLLPPARTSRRGG